MTNWDHIVNEIGPEIFRLARRITGRDEDAEDVLQEVFLELHEFQQHTQINNWRAILRHKTAHRSLDRLRRTRPTSAIDQVEIPSHDEGPVQTAILNELTAQLRCAIAQLPDQQAAVFCLRYFDGRSNTEIAESLGISAGAVATALHKARQNLAIVFCDTPPGESE